MKIHTLLSLVISLGTFFTAQAEWSHPHPKMAQVRIAHGIRNGKLTPAEAKWLIRDQRQIQHLRQIAKRNDGRIGPRERMIIRREKARANRHIFRMKHNRWKRF